MIVRKITISADEYYVTNAGHWYWSRNPRTDVDFYRPGRDSWLGADKFSKSNLINFNNALPVSIQDDDFDMTRLEMVIGWVGIPCHVVDAFYAKP